MPRTTPSPLPPLGIVLRHLREEAGWTQTQLEAAAGLGPTAVTKLERGIHHLSRLEAERLVRILGYPEGWVARTLAVVEQLPRFAAVEDSPAALTPGEYLAVETVAFGLSRRVTEAARADFGAALRARRWEADRRAAGKAWQRFRRLPQGERPSLVASEKDFQTWAFCERLCFESTREAPHDADKARNLAELALAAAESSPGHEDWQSVLKGFALAFVANSWRVLGDFQQANRTMLRSEGLFKAKGEAFGPLDPTWVLHIRANLWNYQRHYVGALAALEEGLAIAGRPDQRARLLITKASVLRRKEDYAEALTTLREAAGHAVKAGDDRLHVVIAFNQATYLCEFGSFDEAEGRLAPLRRVAFRSGKALDILRLKWLEARVESGLGRRAEAAASLAEVWDEFAQRKLWFEAALASLELASIELERGRTRDVKLLAVGAAPVFAAQKFPEELFASLKLFWEAARREVASAENARKLLKELRRAGREAGRGLVPDA